MDCPVEPNPTFAAISAAINSSFFLGGGIEDRSHVHVFDSSSGAWTAKQTTGTPPPRDTYGASTSVGDIMYTYGGLDHHNKDTGCLYELNIKTLVWQLLSQEGPMKKNECVMAAIKERLILFGGLTSSPGDIQPESQCVKDGYGDYYLNELHVYNLKTSMWSSPAMSGDRPPPCSYCTLTAIDPYTVVMFGGFIGKKQLNDLYIMDFAAMKWRKKSSNLFGAWPAGRSGHSATHLSFDEDHQMLLVIGGWYKSSDILSDIWLLDLKTWKWYEISSESETIKRNLHSAGVIRSGPHLVEVLLFGGLRSGDWIAETRVLKFEIPQGGAAGKQRVFLSKILNLQDLWDRGEESRKQSAALPEEVDKDSAESALLKDYPQLPVVQSTEMPQGGTASKQRVFLSKILNLQDLWGRGEENRKQAAALPEEVDKDSAESALLKDYPPLPVVQNAEPTYTPGFSVEKDISVTYRGEKGSVMWKEAGLQLLFEEDKDLLSQTAIKYLVQVSDSEGSCARLPSMTEVVSPVFRFISSQKLNSSATLKILHEASDVDVDQLRFLTSTDDQPPYDYQIIQGGHFTSTHGEISVQHFSFFTICNLCSHYGVKGVLTFKEKRFVASLYCSSQPKLVMSGCMWNIYLSVVKNCSVFRHSVKSFIREEYQDDVKLVTGQVLCLNDTSKSVTAHHHFDPQSAADVTLIEPSCMSLKRKDIKRYIRGRPPLLEYSLHSKSLCPLELKMTLEGFEEETTFTLRHIHLPEPSVAAPVCVNSTDSGAQDVETASVAAAASATTTVATGKQEPMFTLKNLTLLKADPPLRLIEVLSPDWEEAADLLGMSQHRVRIIRKDHSQSAEDCCRALISHWLYDVHGAYPYKRSWNGMCDLLKDMKKCGVAKKLKSSLSY